MKIVAPGGTAAGLAQPCRAASDAVAKETARLDALAGAYAGDLGARNRDLVSYYTCRAIAEHVSPTDKVLLMGLGDGLLAQELAARCAKLLVVEGSADLAAGFRPPPRCTVEVGLFESFACSEGFDVVLGTHVLEHVDDPVIVLRQSTRWLAANGLAVFTVPNRTSLHRRIGRHMGILRDEGAFSDQDIRLGHRRVYDMAALESDLRTAGYRRIEIRGYNLKLVSTAMMAGWSRQLFDALYEVSGQLPPDLCADLLALCRP
jgi:SAM-dependent methyltransferase